VKSSKQRSELKSMAASDADQSRSLVRNIVLAQGNVFIKELLRSKGIQRGTNKAEFEGHMLRAIEEGRLSRSEIDTWLESIEGWGNQHVYLYHISPEIAGSPLWASIAKVRKRLASAKLDGLLNREASLEYPPARRLSRIGLQGSTLSFVWQQGLDSWLRDPDKDQKDLLIEDDIYELRAFRKRADRSIMRFDFQFDKRLAAVFLQIPWNKAEHQAALREATEAAQVLLDVTELKPFSTSSAIKKLDQAQLASGGTAGPQLTTQRTRLSDAGTYVEFASLSDDHGYRDSEAVRQVRLSLKTARFSGTSASFLYEVHGPQGAAPTVKIDLFGEEHRIKIGSQLTREAVWGIINFLSKFG
jgi:hypothetical protein